VNKKRIGLEILYSIGRQSSKRLEDNVKERLKWNFDDKVIF